jgi:hypothetical protein
MIRHLLVLLVSTAPICWVPAAPHKNRVEKPPLSVSDLTKEFSSISTVRERVEPWFRVKSAQGPMGWIPSHRAWPALSFARYASVSPSARFYAKPGEMPVKNSLKESKTVALLSSRPPWYEIQISPEEKVWASFEELKPIPQDLGFGYLLTNQRVSTPQGLIKLDRGTRFHPLAVKGPNQVQVKIIEGDHAGQVLWLSRDLTLSKLNFAESIQIESGNVAPAQLPKGAHKLQKITTPTRWLLNGRSALSLYAEPREDAKVLVELPASSPMALVESDWQIWSLSPSMIYGTQWSLKHSVQLTTTQSQSQLTSAEVFSRPIFDMSSSPKSAPPMTILSAGGVFLRHGSGPWTKLENFGVMNLPVSITGVGNILVGDQISEDQGKTFRPIMAWDKVMAALPESARGEVRPRVLKIQTLDHKGDHLLYHLDLGSGNLAVAETKDQGTSWKVRPL